MKLLIQPILIFIAVLISTSGADEVIYAQVGDTVTISCPQKPYMYWAFQGRKNLNLAWINHLGGKGLGDGAKEEGWIDKLTWSQHGSLVISKINHENFGTYHCQLTSNGESVTTIKVLKLDVSMKPSSPLLPWESLSLSCSVDTQGDRRPNIHWLKPNKVIMHTGNVNKVVQSQENGVWTCVVSNGGKVKEVTVLVTVVDFSLDPLHTQYTSESMPLTIPCSFAPRVSWEQLKARGVQEIYWQFFPKSSSGHEPQKLYVLSMENTQMWNNTGKNKELKPVPGLQSGNLSLTKKRGRMEDQGEYVCIMKFKNGATLNRTVRVEMLRIIASPRTDLVSGQPLNLTCSVGHPLPPDLHLQWSPPQRSSQSSLASDHHPANLIIPEVGTGDGGKWVCALWQDKTKLTSAEITLKIEPKLSVWMLVIICSAAASVFLILTLVFIFCRRRQRKVRHLRHRLCQCKNPKPKGFYRT